MILITGSTGLIGSAASFFYLNKKKSNRIDNDLRSYFFGKKGSNKWKELILKKDKNYKHFSIDIRNKKKIFEIFKNIEKK
jgi:CDP-paratose 2-epimerase